MRLTHGAYMTPETWQQLSIADKCRARHIALLKTHPGYVLSHVSAAFWVGAPLLSLPSNVWVSAPSQKPPRTQDMRSIGNRAEICRQALEWGGVFVTSHLQTAVDCARTLPLEDALCIADFMLHRGYCGYEELTQALTSVRSRGATNTRRVAQRMSAAAESPAETLTRNLLIQWGVEIPRQQAEMWVNGRLYRPDFLWEKQRVILEVDGEVKYSGAYGDPVDVIQAEHRRQRELERAGYKVIRVRWRDIRQNHAVLYGLLRQVGLVG